MLKDRIKRTCVAKIWYHFWNEILQGFELYKGVLKKYDVDNCKICYVDYFGTGDTYISCAFLLQLGILRNNDVLMVPSISAKRIAELFNLREVEIVDLDKLFSVRKMELFSGKTILAKPLLFESESQKRIGCLRQMQAYNEINFMDLLKVGYEVAFDTHCYEKVMIQSRFDYNSEELISFFINRNLKEKKTVVISPYAGRSSLWGFVFSFYCKLAEKLIQKGYCVCTNTSGGKSEQIIPNTIPIGLPYNMMVPFCEKAGYFIGVRSGLCDIISSAKLIRKIVLYPSGRVIEGTGTSLEFFSLNSMGLCDDAIEKEYTRGKEEDILNDIIRMF